MDAREHRFLDVSERLTGFTPFELAGTGMTTSYLSTLDAILPPGTIDHLLIDWPREGDATIEDAILADPTYGPVARNIVLLWYRGTWSALPEEWRAEHGASPLDADRVISSAAYRAGLQWTIAAAHPAGAAQQGYAAWATAPATVAS